MNFYIIIPAHNEAEVIGLTLESLLRQTLLPKQVVVVNDNSTDNTADVVESFIKKEPRMTLINSKSSNEHLPGSKIINAFYKGLDALDENYDVICKFDADLIFPENYLEQLTIHFRENNHLGMVSGFCYIKDGSNWKLENLTRKDHIRGGLKAYRKQCFQDIGKLKRSMGWDTVDELLARYHDWEIQTDESLHVKHLKPTGQSYSNSSKYLQGEAMYKMRYGLLITMISGFKLAYRKGQMRLLNDYITGYFRAKKNQAEYLVSKDEGHFIRKLRWKGMLGKLNIFSRS